MNLNQLEVPSVEPKKVVEDYCRSRNLMVVAAEDFHRFDEPKRGKWIKDGDAYSLYRCTACNGLCTVAGYADCIPEKQMYKAFKFCPNCGAKMEMSRKEDEQLIEIPYKYDEKKSYDINTIKKRDDRVL